MQQLRVVTRMGALALGLDHAVGSVHEVRLADLIMFARDPREGLRRSEDIDLVMIDGRLFDARTFAEIAPRERPLPAGPPVDTVFDLGDLCGCGAH